MANEYTAKTYGSDRRRQLYDNLTKDGFNLGTWSEFNTNLDNKELRQSLYEAAKGAGWELPDYDQFDKDMTLRRLKIKGEVQEVDDATYDSFMARRGNQQKAEQIQAMRQPKPSQPQSAPAQPVSTSVQPEQTGTQQPEHTGTQPQASSAPKPVVQAGTPLGTAGSGTGQGRSYKPFAPGQVRTTDYPADFDPNLTAAQRDEIERQNNFAVKQNQQLFDDFRLEEERRAKPLVNTGNEAVNRSVIKPQGQWDDELAKSVQELGGIVSPMVSDAMKKADDTWWKIMEQSAQVPRQEGMEMADLRRANEATDPDKILQGLQESLKAAYDTPEMKAEIEKRANALGVPKDIYLQDVVAPALQQRLDAEFTGSQIAQRLPKNTTEYILQGLNNSIFGMLGVTATQTEAQRRYANEATAMTEEGLNPYYNPGTGARLAQMGVTFSADAPFFGLYGRVGGQVVKKVAERQIQRLMAKGLSEGAARSIVGSSLENSAGARMRQYIMQHVGSGAITMGGFNATSEGARQLRDKEFDPLKLAGATAEGVAMGTAFGLTGGVSQALSQPLSGFSKVGAKVAGFGAEAETLYATEELSKMVQGEEGFTNPFEGSVEALMKLGVMKASSGHPVTKAVEAGVNIKNKGLGKAVADALSPTRSGVNFTDDEQNYIRNSVEGKNLVESLTMMHPEVAISEVNGKKKLTKEGEQYRQQLSRNYNDFMNNSDIPATVKQKVAGMMGGIYKPGLETGVDIVQNEDGSVVVKTRDKDGNCIRDIKFDNYDEAKQWQDQYTSQLRRNDAVNMWNTASEEARKNIVDAVRDQISGGSAIEEQLKRANGMTQARMQRALDELNQLRSQYEGRELTEEEALNYIQTVIRDGGDEVFNELYDVIRNQAHPADELNTKRNYWEGTQMSDLDRHFAIVDQQVAEERLMQFGEEFANDVMNGVDYPDEKIAELASDPAISGSMLNAALDYYNKASKVQGMMDHAETTVNEQVEAANAYVRKNTHTGSGKLISCTMNDQMDNGNYFVTAGDLQLNSEGQLVAPGTGGAIILRNKETGEIKVVSPHDIQVTSIEEPNRIIAENESMEGLRGQLIKEADDNISLNPETPAEPMNGDVFVGQDGKQYMTMQVANETGNPVWAKMTLDEEGNPVGEPMPLDIDEYRQAKSVELDQLYAPAEEPMVQDNPQPISENTQGVLENTPEVSEITPEVSREGQGSINTADGQGEHQSTITSRIPVDEKGRPQYVQAAPEDTLAELTEKYGEEKAQQMIARLSENTGRKLEELQNKDMSDVTDMADLAAHEDEIATLQRERDYWNSISQTIKTEKAKKAWNNLVNPEKITNFATNPEGQQKWVDDHIDEIADAYIATHGNKLDPDELRKVFTGIGYDGKNVPEFKRQTDRLSQAIYERMLKEAVENGNASITLLTGAGGAGKSTATRQMDMSGRGVVYDAAFNHFSKLSDAIEDAKAAGMKNIQVIAVYNDAGRSFENTIDRGTQSGRYLSLDYFVNGAFLPNQGKIAELRRNYPDVEIVTIDNSGNKASERPNSGRVSVDEAEKWNYTINDAKYNELLNIFENGINNGRLTEDAIASIGRGLRESTRNIPDLTVQTEERVSRLIQRISGQASPDIRTGISGERLPSGGHGVVAPADGGVQGSSNERPSEGASGENRPGNGPEPPAAGAAAAGQSGQHEATPGGSGASATGGGRDGSTSDSGQPAVDQKKGKVYQNTVEANRGRTFTFTYNNGTRSELTIQRIDHQGNAVVTRQDYDAQGNPIGEPREERYYFAQVGESIINGSWKKQLNVDEELRQNHKYDKFKVGDVKIIDVLTDEEKLQVLDALRQNDKDKAGLLTEEFINNHREDFILRGRDMRNEKIEKAFARSGKGERLRGIREQYKNFGDASALLEDEAMQPQTIEEYVADLLGDVPKQGTGPIAYTSYGEGENRVIGLQDETGFGSRGFGGDTKGFNPWLAPNGKGMSFQKFAETIHSQLPEAIQDQYTDQDIRNVLWDVLTSAEKPTDISNYILRNRVEQAEAEARNEEERWMEEPSFQKIANDNSFASRLQRSKESVNTEPTEGQREVGNYKKGHLSFGGYDFTIENPEGSMRRGKDATGREWEQKMNNTYGYILGKYGKDGDHLDMFINDKADLDNWNGNVYVVDQVDPRTGEWDEHKILYGFDSLEDAKQAYLSNYEEGWKGLGAITGVSKENFDKWVDSSKRKVKEFAEHSIARDHMVEEETVASKPEKVDEALRKAIIEHLRKSGIEVSDDWQIGQKILDDYNNRMTVREDGDGDIVKAQKVTDQKTLDELNNGKTVKRYRAMQLIDGKLYPPMSAKVDGEMRQPTEIGVWEQSEERPDLVKKGKFVLNKAQKGQSNVPAAYNPYFHTSTSGLNDQFTSAYRRPELVVVEVEIPESELTSGYKAEGAKDAVGNVEWHSGVVNSQLPADRQRQVTLSRYSKVNRIVPDSEVADMIAKQLEGTNVEIPYNVVTPQLRKELEARGVKISDKPAGLKQQKVSPTFYSNAAKAVEGIKQEKATPEQWLKMIEKGGGLKAGEDKWIGLSDWLKEQQANGKKSLTKQEVEDYIRQNQIKVEEVDYSENAEGTYRKLDDLNKEYTELCNEYFYKYDDPVEIAEHAFNDMVSKYGEDFQDAFEIEYDRSRAASLIPSTDMYGEPSDLAQKYLGEEGTEKPINSTRLRYTTDGLENKKEIALTVPTIEPYNESDSVHFGDAGGGRAVAWVRFGDTTTGARGQGAARTILDDIEKRIGTTTDYSKMSDEDAARRAFANYLWRDNPDVDWMRTSEIPGDVGAERAENVVALFDKLIADNANGKRVLVIDEIQSKRHQDAREKGYREDLVPGTELYNEYHKLKDDFAKKDDEYDEYLEGLRKKYGQTDLAHITTAEERQTSRDMFRELENVRYDLNHFENVHHLGNFATEGVPVAPFEKNWHELAMKRMLRYAAENGYDKIAWTTGEQQAERYDIGNALKEIYTDVPEKGEDKRRFIAITPLDRNVITMRVNPDNTLDSSNNMFNGKDITEVFGKDLANRILASERKTRIKDEGLRIGGEGMKGFYDDILVRFMNKYGKKWGVKVEKIELPEIGQTMWSIDVTPEMKESVMQGQPMFFKTKDGQAYGYTYQGKIYLDPRIATSETPIHEYSHLWSEMKRQTSPEEWNEIKKVMLGDKLVQPILDRVRREYPELTKEGREDDFIEEIITQFSGKRGNERLREIADEIAKEKGGVFGKAEAITAMQRLKNILNRFWEGVAKMMGWKYRNANQIADRIMADLLNSVNPVEEVKKVRNNRADQLKQRQLDLILKNNPADDENMPGHTWIRSAEDINTFREALEYDGYSADEDITPDFTADMVKDALENGAVTVYSSKPIKDGTFVTPSKMEAKNYAGDGKVYSKEVPLTDVAWIDATQGQYAKVSDGVKSQKVDYSSDEEKQRTETIFNAAKKLFGTTRDIREAGYVLPDGTMPDFSGRHQMEPGSDTSFLRGGRTTDHRDIADIGWEKDGNTKTGIDTDMPDFIRRGAIRIDDNAGFINLSTKPTDKQKSILRQLIARNDGDVQVEFGDGWDSDHYVEYDAAKPAKVLADIDRYFDEGIKPDNSPKFQLVGKKGAEKADEAEGTTMRQDNMKVAEEMEKAGKDTRAIKLATGWERGKDGQWRYETVDADVDVLKPYEDKLKTFKGVRENPVIAFTLDELIGEKNELFKYYPEMKNVTVLFDPNMEVNIAGSADGNNIALNSKLVNRFDNHELDNESMYGTLLHEVQHIIQSKEGFAQGGSLSTATTEAGMEAIMHKKEMQRSRVIREIDMYNKWLSSEKELEMTAQLDGLSVEEERKSLTDYLDTLAAQYDNLTAQIDRIYKLKTVSMTDALNLYQSLAGEVEARNVTERMGMSEQERRNTPAEKSEDIARENQVVIMEEGQRNSLNGKTAAERVAETEIGGALVDRLNDMGVDVGTDFNENRKVRKAAEKDNSEAGKIRNFETPDGKVYGFTYKGKMYLDPRKIDGELPIHEYGHLWCGAFRKLNPDGWQKVVDTMKTDADSWDAIKKLCPGLTEEHDIAEEMISKYSGEKGAKRLRAELERMSKRDEQYASRWNNIFKNISKSIQDFWKQMGSFLHIKYDSPEQVYDQVMKDFANKVNPQSMVERYLQERDADYMKAAEAGDEAKAAEIFNEALRENIGNGITPFIAADRFFTNKELAHAVKTRDEKAVRTVAEKIAPLIPKDAVLVPAPGHSGEATDMLDVANALAEMTGAEVADVLKSESRASQYNAKKAGKPLSADEMGITMQGELPKDKVPVVIDNVVDTGNTAEACVKALGKGVVVTLGDATKQYDHTASLKSAEPIVKNCKGEIIPLSERFEMGGSKYLGKVVKPQQEETGLLREGEAQQVELNAAQRKYTPKQMRDRQAFAERQWRRAHEWADDTVKKLNLGDKVRIVDGIDELEGHEKFSARKKNAKGWYDPDTDSIVIVMGNHRSPTDVVKTILHEGVAHHGLRKLFGDNYDTFLNNAYKSATFEIRDSIDELAKRYDGDVRKATEEYLGKLAEDTEFESAEKKTWLYHWFNQIKSYFLDMLKELGLPGYDKYLIDLTDNELRYILWRSYQNLSEPGRYKNVFQKAKDVTMRNKLAKEEKLPVKGHIEDEIPKIVRNHADEVAIDKKVAEMSLDEAMEAYKRIDDIMRDEQGRDLDEQFEAHKQEYIKEHGIDKGLGKAMSNDLQAAMDKYGSGMVELRWNLMDHIEKLGGNVYAAGENKELYRDGEEEAPKMQRVNPEPELTEENRQYWKKWDEAMKKWKQRHGLAADAEAPSAERPRFQPGENAMDFAKRLTQYNREKALWNTAPKLEDYHQVRDDKDIVDEARENLKRYPESQSAKMRMVAAELSRLRHAMSRQRAYDKATVKAVTDFAQDFMKQGFGDNLSRGEMERMLSSVKNATGAKDIRKQVDNIMNILIDNHLRNLEYNVTKLASVKELSKTAQGVEKQGKLELKGQQMIQAYRKAREERLTADEIREKMAEITDKMTDNPEEKPMLEQEYEGLSTALQYAENIDASRKEWADLDREYKDAVKDYKTSGRSYQAQQELLESIEQAMMENKIERIGMFGNIICRLQGNIAESIEGAKAFREQELERINKIHSWANFDTAGQDMSAFRVDEKGKKDVKGKPINFFLSPTATFEQLLKQFGGRNANGEGYLYDNFMRSWIDSTDKAFLGEKKAKEELGAKARELFGDKVKRWSDLYKLSTKPGAEVTIVDQGEEKTLSLSQGNLLYIYMADKMPDGRMKLRKMGITEEDVENIKNNIDPRLIELGDWLQDDYLAKKRTQYNKVHERMFGAPMASIDHYFPLRILGDARVQEQDVANMADQDSVLPSTITGNIIKRRRNALPLDILGTDALSLALEHVEDMERWAATAEWNRDINTLLSYTTFRNKVKNMKTIYGSGDALWNTFADTARMAAGTYRPKVKPGSVDKTISNIAKGVTAAKINFRVYTAFKQLLSAPAFLHDVRIDDFAKHAANPYGSWKWAMENMPVFRKRWESRQIGDTRLMDDDTDWKLWKSDITKLAARIGMSPNALVDGVTCAVGARAIYDTKYRGYKKLGASDEVARKRALQDAEIGYNLTQQSSEGAFVSAIQKDRTVAANMLSVFRNSSMSYTRQWIDAARNLKHRMQKGYREDSIRFMKHQLQDQFDMTDEQAQQAAEQAYARAGRRDIARMLNMMFGVTVAWNLGASLPYLLIGDDDKTKKEMMTDALIKGLIAGPTEGFAAGNLMSDVVGRMTSEETRNAIKNEGWGAGLDAATKQAGDYEINPLPLMADIQSLIGKLGYDKYAAAQDVFNIVAQSAVGVNPQTFTDMWNAIMDYAAPGWDGTKYTFDADNMKNAKELALFMMRLINAPTSSWRNKYIDELGMDATDAKKLPYEEMAKRYAHYKHWKDAPIMGWLRSDEAREEKMDKIQKQFDKAVEQRMSRLTADELMHNVARSESPEEKRKYAKLIAQQLGVTPQPGGDSGKADEKHWYQELYQRNMLYDDIVEDEMMAAKYKDLENTYKEKREEAERQSMQDLKEFNKANKEWKQRIDEAKSEVKKRMDWIRDGKYDTPSGKRGNSKKKEYKLLAPGKKQMKEADEETVMKNIRQWRKEALEYLMRAEDAGRKK